VFKVNDHQYIEVEPTLKQENEDRLSHIAFETSEAGGYGITWRAARNGPARGRPMGTAT